MFGEGRGGLGVAGGERGVCVWVWGVRCGALFSKVEMKRTTSSNALCASARLSGCT